jgi:hypothetical protein
MFKYTFETEKSKPRTENPKLRTEKNNKHPRTDYKLKTKDYS